MKKFNIVFSCYSEVIEVEDYECEQDAVDKLVDKLERQGDEGCFINADECNDDEYAIGGNHGLALFHGGNFLITKL